MKKLLYIVLIAFASSIALTSCTEENVVPATNDSGSTNTGNTGGGGTSGGTGGL